MTSYKQVMDTLQDMSEWDSIADRFVKMGLTGFIADCDSCPIAHYLGMLHDVPGLSVGPLGVLWHEDGHLVQVPLPMKVREFMNAFDQGDYPDLIAEHSKVGAYV